MVNGLKAQSPSGARHAVYATQRYKNTTEYATTEVISNGICTAGQRISNPTMKYAT